jgi:hypothetical protein
VYGVFGTHMTLAHAGRIYLWGPPGILVLRNPGGQFEVKMTWGVDVLVGHVPVPFGPKYTLPLYVTIAKVFGQAEGTALQKGANAGLNMVGLSVTIKR